MLKIKEKFNSFCSLLKSVCNKILSYKHIYILFSSICLLIGGCLNYFYPMHGYWYKAILLLAILIIALSAEKKYINDTDILVREMTGSRTVEMPSANKKLINNQKSVKNYLIPIIFILYFGLGSIYLKLIDINPLGIYCLFLFVIIVFFSIKGYLQYIYLAEYIWRISSADFEQLGIPYDKSYPALTRWLVKLTELYQIYRNCFFATGTLYIVSFYIFTSDYTMDLLQQPLPITMNKIVLIACWAAIFIAIVLLFPIVSISEYYSIQKIVRSIKTLEIKRLKKIMKRTNNEVEYTPLIISIWETANYPVSDFGGKIFSFVIALFNLAISVYPIFASTA